MYSIGEIVMFDQKKIQNALDLLLDLHDDEEALRDLRILSHLENKVLMQNAIAGLCRYLCTLRDRKNGS